ncbi:MAG: DNA polymerase I [Armatimonadetes bacterium 55-13]|nr:DNA polymerase I [Armatimonadota bacterium]OJU62871.1 MAG: DNA polymerase I [Armatimonadetes bacterium 55-13]
MDPKRLVIIDGYSLLYRAFFATRYLSTADGKPTNALYGFTQMLFLLLENIGPDAIVVALDAPGKTFRHAEFAEYKGTRRETAEELKVQLPIARELIAALGIPSVEVTGYEADDVVGTISQLAEKAGYDTTIVTGDLDSLQLVDEHVSVLTMKLGVTDTVTYDEAAVFERWGVSPIQVPDFKAIKGDTSDNIPGVPGIGDKGGAELIQTFGSVEGILERFSEVPPKYAKKIEPVIDQLKMSKFLATIKRDVPLEYDFQPFLLTPDKLEKAKAMLEFYEFKSLHRRADKVLGRYLEGAEREAPVAEVESEALEVKLSQVDSYEGLASFVKNDRFAIYFSSAAARDLFDDPERKAYIAVGKNVVECPEADALRFMGENASRAILHDAKPAYKRLDAITENPVLHVTPGFDSLLAAFVLQSGRSAYGLRDLVQGYLDIQPPSKPEEMAAALHLLEPALRDRLKKEEQEKVLDEVELPLVPILTEMERFGIRADRDQLREFSKTLQIEIERVTQLIYQLAGQEFTIGSPKQLGEILFDKLQIPGAQKTKTGYATGAEVLGLIAPQYEIAAEVLNWRELTKLKSTYADALEKLIQPDGRIHTTYNQTGAATGRLSSNDPNMQNIPIRTELGRGIRKAFIAADGYRLASFDYSQIELRVLAHMCEEPALKKAFDEHQDVHTVTAQQMFGLGEEPATKEQRRLAKMLNYAVLYGVSEYGLAQQLGGGFSVAEAKELIKQYSERFPSVKAFTDGIVAEARSKGFTRTLLGRRRYFPDIHAAKLQERRYAERQAMNAPIQGTAADMLKLAMIDVRKQLNGLPTRMLLNVHDELVFELKDGDDALIEPIRSGMESALPLNVPVEVDAKIGSDWNEMTPV